MTIRSDRAVAPSATRMGPDGSSELAEFRGSVGKRMLAHTHLPGSTPRGAVVICSPLLGELMRNYRREVLFARRLVRSGFAVERFHYRFTGNSDGDDDELTFESMRADALESVAHLRSQAPEGPLFLLGTRWGALIAASAAAAHPEAGLVLWEPLLDASLFFKEAFRSFLVNAVRDGVESPPTRRELEERLEAGATVEVPAHRIHSAFYRSAAGRSVAGELGVAPRDVLAVQVALTGSVRPDLAQQVETWRQHGLRVDAAPVRGSESWWLVDERAQDERKWSVTRDLISLTERWLRDRAPQGGQP